MQILLHIIYIILGYIAYPFLFIAFIIKAILNKNTRTYYLSKLGLIYPKANNKGQAIWIHALSISEVSAIKSIVTTMLKRRYNVYISTTIKGYERAKLLYGDKVNTFYLPVDHHLMIAKVIDRISAEYVLISELEMWPVLIYELHKKSIPLYLINAHIRDKNVNSYKFLKHFFKPYFKMYKKIFAQSEKDRENLIKIGMDENRIIVTGNIRYDVNYNIIKEKYDAINASTPKNKFILVVSSTHAEEEPHILDAIKKANIDDDIYLVLSAYDTNRFESLYKLALEYGYNVSLYTNKLERGKDGIIINISTDMSYWYKRADLVIIGGSFLKEVGGHNILEPIFFSKPVIVGPYMQSFSDMYEYMKDTIATCKSYIELTDTIKNFHDDEQSMTMLGNYALMLLIDNKGASENTISAIDRYQGKLDLS